jgi:Questin oxidase-like
VTGAGANNASADEALVALLDAGQAQGCEYGEALSNHLPMALVSLHRLGASKQRLRDFAKRHGERLPPADAPGVWPAGDPWPSRLGERHAFAAYRQLFTLWRDDEGATRVLEQVLPTLMQGCSGVAFHGLIRTAYAVQSRHAGEFVSGLAYWACRWQALPALPSGLEDTDDPEPLLQRLPAVRSRRPLIAQRMLDAARREPAIGQIAARLAVGERSLPHLAVLAASAYAHSGGFTALHLVTSAHALRVLMPYLDDPVPPLRAYWTAFAHAVAVAGLVQRPLPDAPPWSELMLRAAASDDDHVVKLVDSCREQSLAHADLEAAWGQPWQRAASRAVAGA